MFCFPCSGSSVHSYLRSRHEAAGVPPLFAEVFTRFSFLLDHLLPVLGEDLLGTPVELRVLDEAVPVGEPRAAQRAAVRLLTLHTVKSLKIQNIDKFHFIQTQTQIVFKV